MSKEGSTLSGLLDSFAISISMGLQHGVPLQEFVDKFKFVRFEPSGWTGNKEIPMALSIIDYVFKWLELRFLKVDNKLKPSLLTEEEKKEVEIIKTEDEAYIIVPQTVPTDKKDPLNTWNRQSDAPACKDCGGIMQRAGSCYCCTQCGTTSGCS
jgi:ribonucleoside-diphosphate reductase alpha chain